MKKHFKKVVIILLLLFASFLLWLGSYEPKKETFKHSDFYIENIESNEKILNNSKLYNEDYRKYLQKKKQEQEEKQEHKSKKKKKERGRKSSKKVKEENGKIKEKTQRARIRKEQENNRLDKYIFKHKMKSKKRP